MIFIIIITKNETDLTALILIFDMNCSILDITKNKTSFIQIYS